MNALRRIGVMAAYEWKRALAKKKVLALVILALAIESLTLIVFQQLISSAGQLFGGITSFMWIIGALQGQGLFVQLVAIVIAGGSMSEEYEHGTADILLSKPVKRTEYLAGKFLGGFSLLALIEGLTTILGVILSLWFFGSQDGLQFAPLMLLAIVYSSLIFFGLSFMLSEVLRRTTLAMLLSLAVLITSSVLSTFLAFLYALTQSTTYLYATRGIPTWGATSIPSLLMGSILDLPQNVLLMPDPSVATEARVRGVAFSVVAEEALAQGIAIVAIYAVALILIAIYRLRNSDVTKKTD